MIDWADKDDQWTAAIEKAHPTVTDRHDLYVEALEMVGNRHSKGALVDLVNWLLAERDDARLEALNRLVLLNDANKRIRSLMGVQ